EGRQVVKLLGSRFGGTLRFTLDGSIPTADSEVFYPGVGIYLSENTYTRLKIGRFVDDVAVEYIEGVYALRRSGLPPSQLVYYGLESDRSAYSYTNSVSTLAKSTNLYAGLSRLTFGYGSVESVSGVETFVADLSGPPESIYYGGVLVPSSGSKVVPL